MKQISSDCASEDATALNFFSEFLPIAASRIAIVNILGLKEADPSGR